MKIPSDLKWQATDITIGKGGQATVIQVFDKNDDNHKPYALKALARGKPKKAYKRFIKEIEAIKNIDHPYIIKIIDHSDIDADFQYYVMEYLPGAISLKKLLNSPQNPFYKDSLEMLFFKFREYININELPIIMGELARFAQGRQEEFDQINDIIQRTVRICRSEHLSYRFSYGVTRPAQRAMASDHAVAV